MTLRRHRPGWRRSVHAATVPRALPAVVLTALLATSATACLPEGTPMNARPQHYTGISFAALLAWVETELNRGIAATGVNDGWLFPAGSDPVPWDGDPEHTYLVLGSVMPLRCGDGGRLSAGIVRRDVEDHLEAALRVRAAWEADGWIISDLYAPPSETGSNFRADRADGAVLGFDGNAEGLILEVHTACSGARSMAAPSYPEVERDEFLAEVRARGAE